MYISRLNFKKRSARIIRRVNWADHLIAITNLKTAKPTNARANLVRIPTDRDIANTVQLCLNRFGGISIHCPLNHDPVKYNTPFFILPFALVKIK